VVALVLVFTGGPGADLPPAPPTQITFRLAEIPGGFAEPVLAWGDAAEPDALYVVEQAGRIVRTEPDTNGGARSVVLDIRDQVRFGGERGLLGATFDPADRSRLYVHYSDLQGDTVVSRFTVAAGLALPDERIVLRVDQPYSNHNGGMIAFGPDGMLYVGLGDGGSGGDPDGNGQDPHTLLGTILRLDVAGDPPGGYRIPADNPFTPGQPRAGQGAGEVWAYGLRNPWRFHFDPETGDLWVGDVGQNRIEELDRIPADGAGANLGWNHWEGSQAYGTRASRTQQLGPVAEYDHDGGHCSITGGPVARGDVWRDAGLDGAVFYADYCSGVVWMSRPDGAVWRQEEVMETGFRVSSFGAGPDGRIFVVDHGGSIHELVAE
jgi:glucose/arabinose dehydrogenase